MQTFIPYENHANAAFRRTEKNLFFSLKLSPFLRVQLQSNDLHIFD